MLAGDFTAFASPACNGGRQIALRGGVREQPHRSRAVQSGGAEPGEVPADDDAIRAARSPTRCGNDSDERQYVGRVDYQRTADRHDLRPVHGHEIRQADSDAGRGHALSLYDASNNTNVLGLRRAGALAGDRRHARATAPTRSIRSGLRSTGAASIASRRRRSSRTTSARMSTATSRHVGVFIVSGNGFRSTIRAPSRFTMNASQIGDDLTLVRGDHQIAVGGSLAYWQFHFLSHARSGGNWTFKARRPDSGWRTSSWDGSAGWSTADPAILPMDQWYCGTVRAGRVEDDEPRHHQCRTALGAVLRAERAERRRVQLQPRQLPEQREDTVVRQRAGRSHLSRRCRLPAGPDAA